jgi:hypothetical protein
MFPRTGEADLAGDVATESARLIDAFRRHCLAAGYTEALRVGLARHHDPSVRFTNSTISALKAHLGGPIEEPMFLIQPALRLRNLTHWLEHGEMSGFGCYFFALGSLASPDRLAAVHHEVATLLCDGAGIAPERILMRSSSADGDLRRAAAGTGLRVEVDGYAQSRYRHVFGIEGVTGRNTNAAVVTDTGPVDVANVIIIERDGQPVAVEAAYGVNMVLAQRDRMRHPVLASVGAAALSYGISSLITLDALGSAVALATEGLRPVARGRGGKLRTFLKLIAADESLYGSELTVAVSAVVAADHLVRRHTSPLTSGLVREAAQVDVVEAVVRAVAALA